MLTLQALSLLPYRPTLISPLPTTPLHTFHQPPPFSVSTHTHSVSLLNNGNAIPCLSRIASPFKKYGYRDIIITSFCFHFGYFGDIKMYNYKFVVVPVSRWKSYGSATCGQSTISVSVEKKWEKFSNHLLSLPELMISLNGECSTLLSNRVLWCHVDIRPFLTETNAPCGMTSSVSQSTTNEKEPPELLLNPKR